MLDEDALLTNPTPGIKHKDAYLRVFDMTKKTMFTDQTGRFPITSAKVHKYTMVAVELDGNYIDAKPLKSRSAKDLTKAYKTIHARWKATGVICPNWHVLDNEAPAAFLEAIRENGCRVELTPADIHRRNIAEQGIQTYKGHFIATMAGVSNDFPIHQWHELVPQIVLTLDLLRQSNVAPNVSAYTYHHGHFDYNRMPLAPMGCLVQFHIKPNRRKTWGEHSSDGWYLTTSPDHYRCHYIFVKATRAKRISDTVFFKHKQITQPTLTTEDLIIKAIQDLTNVIRGNNKPGNKPGNNSQIKAIKQLTTALQPRNQLPLGKASNNAPPRVQTDASPRVQIVAPPRVQFNIEANEDIQFDANEAPQLIVEPPKLIVKSPTKQTPESIANRVKKRL